MNSKEINRRDFSALSLAAMGGLLSGVLSGCGGPGTGTAAAGEKHLCRGLNECKGQGSGGKNECAGQGECATASHHSCGGKNECKGLGGCGEDAGANACKGKGGCHVPLMDDAWTTVRKRLEDKLAKSGKKAGQAPAKKD